MSSDKGVRTFKRREDENSSANSDVRVPIKRGRARSRARDAAAWALGSAAPAASPNVPGQHWANYIVRVDSNVHSLM
jgi:ribosomal protein S20